MNRDTFNSMLREPASISVESRDELLKMVKEYPWCSSAHVLLCKLDHREQHVAYDQHLRRAAVYAYDREALYNLLMGDKLRDTVAQFDQEVESQSDDEVENPKPSVGEAVAEEGFSAASQPDAEISQETLSAEDSQDGADENDAPSARLGRDKEEEEADQATAKRKKAGDFDDLHREIIVEAISSTIEREVDEKDEPEDVPEANEASETKHEITKTPPASEGPETSVTTKPKVAQNITDTGHLSAYAKWLLAHQQAEERDDSATPALADELPADPKLKHTALIDRFIETDPKITPGKADLFSTENLAKMSLVEDEAFVTETMAMIYARQGHKKKAIKAYKLLSLKYPEKSVYFANQIKKL